MKSNRLLAIVETHRTFSELLHYANEDLMRLRHVMAQNHIQLITQNIKNLESSLLSEEDRFIEVCGFSVDLTMRSYDIQDSLEEIKQHEFEHAHMVKAWDSDDEGNAAENDPGLQFEQAMKLEELWREFEEMYKIN